MEEIIKFFNHPFFIVVGGLATLLMIIGVIYAFWLIIRGVLPVWYRLGLGLSQRKIAIFSVTEFASLSSLLADSKIFERKNIVQINKNDMSKAEKETVFLVHWNDFKDKIDDILNYKKDDTALIVYAPQNEGRIDQQEMDKITTHRNTVVVNFRGRLLNDILLSLITTSYKKS